MVRRSPAKEDPQRSEPRRQQNQRGGTSPGPRGSAPVSGAAGPRHHFVKDDVAVRHPDLSAAPDRSRECPGREVGIVVAEVMNVTGGPILDEKSPRLRLALSGECRIGTGSSLGGIAVQDDRAGCVAQRPQLFAPPDAARALAGVHIGKNPNKVAGHGRKGAKRRTKGKSEKPSHLVTLTSWSRELRLPFLARNDRGVELPPPFSRGQFRRRDENTMLLVQLVRAPLQRKTRRSPLLGHARRARRLRFGARRHRRHPGTPPGASGGHWAALGGGEPGSAIGGLCRLGAAVRRSERVGPRPQAERREALRLLRFYPGSPWLLRLLLREQDRLALWEQHPEECEALRLEFGRARRVSIHEADGFGALRAMLPPPERRALILVDPPYEAQTEWARVADALRDGLARFPER